MMPDTALRHNPYVNARSEWIDNGADRSVFCGWPHRDNCPLCQDILGEQILNVPCAHDIPGTCDYCGGGS